MQDRGSPRAPRMVVSLQILPKVANHLPPLSTEPGRLVFLTLNPGGVLGTISDPNILIREGARLKAEKSTDRAMEGRR